MSKTETKAGAVTEVSDGPSPAAEVKTAMAGFINDLNAFQGDIKSKLKQQEERLTMLDRKSVTLGRPALSASADAEAPHQKAFESYVRSGDDDALRGLQLDGKAMSTAVAGDGGYLVDPQTAETVKSVLKSTASLRQIANVVNVGRPVTVVMNITTPDAEGFRRSQSQIAAQMTRAIGRGQRNR